MCSVSDLPMDQIILTSSIFLARNIYTSQWCKFKSKSTERFLFWFLLWIFSVFFFFGGWGGSSIARGGGPPGWHLWTCCISLYRKMSGSLLKLKDLFIFRVTLNIKQLLPSMDVNRPRIGHI